MATDPRKTANPRTVNEILVDRSIRHGIYLTRLAGGEAKWLEKQLPTLRKEITRVITPILADLSSGGAISVTDETLISEASTKGAQAVRDYLQELRPELSERLSEIASHEADFERRLFEKAIPIEKNFNTPSDTFLKNMLRNEPIAGKTMNSWFEGMARDTRVAINDQIRQGMIEGESINDILRRVRGRRENKFRDGIIGRVGENAKAIVRTGVMNASNSARREFHKANSDVIKGYSWVLTLDNRTCPICVDGESQNPYQVESPPELPAHPNCRCLSTAITKSWEELGFDFDEIEPGTRASMNGEVPDTMTYKEWFDDQGEPLQREILGQSRYEQYKNGRDVTAFADNGQILTLEELRMLDRL